MVSPLKDNKGKVRYFLGARIDVTQLVEGGKTIDSFYQLLAQWRPVTPVVDPLESKPTLKALRKFGDLLTDEEKGSIRGADVLRIDSRPSTPRQPQSPTQRRFVGIEEHMSQNGLRSHHPGQTPGVYQNVRHNHLQRCTNAKHASTSSSGHIPRSASSSLRPRCAFPVFANPD